MISKSVVALDFISFSQENLFGQISILTIQYCVIWVIFPQQGVVHKIFDYSIRKDMFTTFTSFCSKVFLHIIFHYTIKNMILPSIFFLNEE